MSESDSRQDAARPGEVCACFSSVISLLRGSVLLVSTCPRTALRVLCVVAFDTLFVLRRRRRLPFQKLRTIASLLDLGACVNTYFDDKGFSRKEYRATRELTKEAGVDLLVDDYLARLRVLEKGRPAAGGDRLQFQKIQWYRESVARLSLVLITASAFDADTIEEGYSVFGSDDEFEIVLRIVMLCQILDDVLDRKDDASAGLPGFLTATASLPLAFDLTRQAAASYRDVRGLSPTTSAFPFRVALFAVSAAASFVMAGSR